MRAEASFLIEGKSYAFDLPDGLQPAPDLYSVVRSNAPRNITYRPYEREPDPRTDPGLSHAFDVGAGRNIASVYRSREEKSTRVAYWRLPNGYLQTFTDDRFRCGDDTDELIKEIIANITVRLGKAQLPVVELRGPLVPGDARDPFERENIVFPPSAVFGPAAGGGWPLVQLFNEPPWITQGSSSWDRDDWAASSETSDLAMTVEVQGPRRYRADLERHAKRVSSSAVPLD